MTDWSYVMDHNMDLCLPPGAGDLTGDPFGYVTGVLAVIIHASYLVLIQKTSVDSEYGPLTAQYAITIMASPVWSLELQACSEPLPTAPPSVLLSYIFLLYRCCWCAPSSPRMPSICGLMRAGRCLRSLPSSSSASSLAVP